MGPFKTSHSILYAAGGWKTYYRIYGNATNQAYISESRGKKEIFILFEAIKICSKARSSLLSHTTSYFCIYRSPFAFSKINNYQASFLPSGTLSKHRGVAPLFFIVVIVLVTPPGLEPGTLSLKGTCSKPTELRSQSIINYMYHLIQVLLLNIQI